MSLVTCLTGLSHQCTTRNLRPRTFNSFSKKNGITLSKKQRIHRAARRSKESGLENNLPKSPRDVDDNAFPSFNLWAHIREARPAVRYTVYLGLGLMATVETTFWVSVLKAKFIPSASDEEKEKAEEWLKAIRAAVKGYRAIWMLNYGRYYGSHVWGLGYGGLDGLTGE